MSKPLETHISTDYDPATDSDVNPDSLIGEKEGTARDVKDMRRLGKPQVLRRNFGFFSILGFSMLLMITWESETAVTVISLLDGGTAGAIYIYIGTFFGFGMAIISMAEMASMAPTAGGQYHWVSEFAPKSAQKFLSYIIGWLCVLGWQGSVSGASYIAASVIQGLIILNNPDYVPQRWHGSLLAIALVLVSTFFNTVLARRLPHVEATALVLHLCGFLAILIPLWVYGSKADAHEVFTTFNDGGNWGSTGLATLVGIISPTLALIGPDAAVHMSEELKNASKTLPRTMMATMIFNGSLGFIMLVTFCFVVGNLDEVLSTPTGYPFIQVFYNATGSLGGATTMVAIMVILFQSCGITNMATASRQLWSFARDKGVPFHSQIAKVPPNWDIPLPAVITTTLLSILILCITFGSTIAFNQLIALTTASLLSAYMMSIGCVFLRRCRGQELLPAYFELGKLGFVVNALALAFLVLAYVMTFFPPAKDPDVESMNWSSVIYVGVISLSLLYYLLSARFKYVGPVEYVRRLN